MNARVRKASHTLVCISKTVASKTGKVVIPLYLALARPHLEYSQYQRDINRLEIG